MAQTIQKKQRFLLTQRDEAIIQAVSTYRYLTAKQITKLFYAKGSLTFVREQLAKLEQQQYLYRFPIPKTSPGVPPYVYTIATKGIKYLKSVDSDTALRFRPSEANEISYQHISHTLAVNDFLIAATLLTKSEPIILHDLRHEWMLKHTPLSVKLAHETISVVPDGFVDFRFQLHSKKLSMPVWLELDRGTERIQQFKRKIRGLVAAIESKQYEELFHTKSVTIAFATTVQGTRLMNMRSWIKQELRDLGKQAESSLFLCTKLPHAIDAKTGLETEELDLDPKTLFLTPMWYLPNEEKPLSLLELS